jgi:hypothetical protein
MPGGYVAAPPFLHRGAVLHAFMMRGDQATLQALVANTLNRAAGMQFDVVTDLVLFTALYVSSVTSTDPRWGGRGTAPETDIGFWVLTRGGRIGQPPKLRWWPTYLFVDSGPALVIGREIYGFPKHMGRINRSSGDLATDPRVAVTTQFFREASPDARPVTDTLVQLRPAAAALPVLAAGQIAPGMSVEALDAGVGMLVHDGLPPAPSAGLPYVSMPMVLLTQFRDAATPSETVCQAVIALDVAVQGVPNIGAIFDPVELVLQDAVSHPIASQHGLTQINRPVTPIIRVEMDFVADRGAPL